MMRGDKAGKDLFKLFNNAGFFEKLWRISGNGLISKQ